MSPPRSAEILDRLQATLTPVVEAAGLYLEGVTVAGAGARSVVRVVVDLPDGPGGVTSDQLSVVSRDISATLDDADLLAGAYTLEVTTPGTDRPLTEPRHFRRAVGRLVIATARGRNVTGRVREAGEDAVVLEVDGRREELPYAGLTRARVQVELNRPEGE